MMRILAYGILLLLTLAGLPAKAQTIPADRLTNWHTAGLQDSVPTYSKSFNIMNYGADNTGAMPSDAALQSAIIALSNVPGNIFFPAGTYLFNQPISVHDSMVLKGVGTATKLRFNLGGTMKDMITFTGTEASGSWNVKQTLAKNDTTIELVSANGLQTGDWVRLYGNDASLLASSWAYGTVGQIFQIKDIQGDVLTVNLPVRRNYETNFAAKLKRIEPVQWAGVECLYIERMDTTASQTSNIKMNRAVNCWVIGVESYKTNFAHIDMLNSAHTLARGNYLHDANGYGGGGQGYGAVVQYTSSDCLIENNIFEHLRHSMLLQAGANGNVIAYNYSRDPYWDEPPFPTNSAGDIVLHGNYPYLNLFEGNIAQNIVIDDSHGINGPYNTFFRNRAELYGIFMNDTEPTDSTNFVGNELTGTTSFQGQYILKGNGHFEYGNNVKGTITPAGTTALPVLFLYLKNFPAYWHVSPPGNVIGTPYPFNSNDVNPAKDAYLNNKLTNCITNPVLLGDAVKDINGQSIQLKVYPNPANSYVSFSYNMPSAKEALLEVTDMMGKAVYRQSVAGGKYTATWKAEHVPAGIYLYKLVQDGQTLAAGKITIAR